ERLALAHLACDLPNEQNERGRILLGNVESRGRVGRTGSARDETDAGAASRLPASFGHDGGAALMPADGNGNIAVVKRIERRDIALARNAEHVPHAMDEELIDQDFAGGPGAVIGAHGGHLLVV